MRRILRDNEGMVSRIYSHTGRWSGKPPARCPPEPQSSPSRGNRDRTESHPALFLNQVQGTAVVGAYSSKPRDYVLMWLCFSQPAAPALVDATISAMPVVMPGGLRQRHHVSAVMVGHAVGNARGIASLMVIAYRPPRSPADPAPPFDAAVHGLAPGLQVAALVVGAGKTGMQPGEGFIFLSRLKRSLYCLLPKRGTKAPGCGLCCLPHSADNGPPPGRDPQCLPPAPGSAATVFYQPFLNRYGHPLRGAS